MQYLFKRTKNNFDWLVAWAMGGAFISEDYVVLVAVFVGGCVLSAIGESITQ